MYMRGNYGFLSNMYNCNVTIDGITYKSAEAAFQAQKCDYQRDKEHGAKKEWFAGMTGGEAKIAGGNGGRKNADKNIVMTLDVPAWNQDRIDVMRKVLKAKFSTREMQDKLLRVHEPIVEENDWNDTFWGVCNGEGQNHLGKLLTEIRTEIQDQRLKTLTSGGFSVPETPKAPETPSVPTTSKKFVFSKRQAELEKLDAEFEKYYRSRKRPEGAVKHSITKDRVLSDRNRALPDVEIKEPETSGNTMNFS